MTDLRAAAEQALEALGSSLYPQPRQMAAIAALKAALAENYCDTHCTWADHDQGCVRAELVQEPYTGDVTRIIREAGMTFHLGLPHKPVIEQMSRVVDLVYAEASIKAAQQFAAPPQRKPLLASDIVTMYDENPRSDSEMIAFARAIEHAHGIGSKT